MKDLLRSITAKITFTNMLVYRIFASKFSFRVLFDEFYLDNYYVLMTILHVDFYKDIFRAYLHSKFTDSAGGHQSIVF